MFEFLLFSRLSFLIALVLFLVVLRFSSAAVRAGVDVPGERPRGGEAPRPPGGGHGTALQLPRRLHPGGTQRQPLHQAGQVGRPQAHLPL